MSQVTKAVKQKGHHAAQARDAICGQIGEKCGAQMGEAKIFGDKRTKPLMNTGKR